MPRDRHQIMADIGRNRVVGIVRENEQGRARTAAEALIAGGLRTIEITLTTPAAIELIGELAHRHSADGILIGAGTVLDEHTAAQAICVGARFVVSPNLPMGVVKAAHRQGVAAVPGAGTASEAIGVAEAGADAVKLFPAGVHGLDWFRSIRSVMPPVPLIPTGSIAPEDVGHWLGAGAFAVGLGGQLTRGDHDAVVRRASRLLARLTA